MKNIAVLLHGSGVYDGTEIQEAVFSLLSIAENGGKYTCIAPNIEQFHVINHITGNEMDEKRNVLIESARIARGEIKDLAEVNVDEFDALVMPGGFGTAKNFTKWAFEGPRGDINNEVKQLINAFLDAEKPIVGLCMSPTTIAKAIERTSVKITVGSDIYASPYEIKSISEGIESLGHQVEMKSVNELSVDHKNKIITAPCYMMETNILEVRNNIKQAIDKLFSII